MPGRPDELTPTPGRSSERRGVPPSASEPSLSSLWSRGLGGAAPARLTAARVSHTALDALAELKQGAKRMTDEALAELKHEARRITDEAKRRHAIHEALLLQYLLRNNPRLRPGSRKRCVSRRPCANLNPWTHG